MISILVGGYYTMLYNVLDFPVGIVPVTKENESDQSQLQDYNDPDLACQLIKRVISFFDLIKITRWIRHWMFMNLSSTYHFALNFRQLKEPWACH